MRRSRTIATEPGPRRRLARVLIAAALAAGPSGAQQPVAPTIDLAFDRPESWALQYFASVALYSAMGPPERVEPGAVEVGFEAGWVPRLDERQRTVGFFGNKPEDLNRTEVFGRPRVDVGLPWDLTLSASWVPPIELFDVESNLLALAVGRPLWSSRRWRLASRLALQAGTLEADFTCPAEVAAAGADPRRNPFDCKEPSRDEAELRSASLEVGAARAWRRVEPYASLAASYLDLEFQVGARYSSVLDRTRYLADGWTWSAAAGVSLPLPRRSRLAVEAFYTPLEVQRSRGAAAETDPLLNLRVLASARLR